MRVAVPPDYVKAHGLQDGDVLLWTTLENGNVRLQYLKIPEGEEAEGIEPEITEPEPTEATAA
jgi:hypothetical protein